MKIHFSKCAVGLFMYSAYMMDKKGYKVPLGLWDDHTVDEMMESIGLQDTCSNIEDHQNCDFVVDFNKKEIEFL